MYRHTNTFCFGFYSLDMLSQNILAVVHQQATMGTAYMGARRRISLCGFGRSRTH